MISDEGAIESVIKDHKYVNNSVDAVAACINAGCNLELSANLFSPVYFSLCKYVKKKISQLSHNNKFSLVSI